MHVYARKHLNIAHKTQSSLPVKRESTLTPSISNGELGLQKARKAAWG
jgi:hypothetical protein